MAKFLVTGGAGFIGSHIVDQLLKQRHKVVVLDNFSSGSIKNLPQKKPLNLTVIDGDILNLSVVNQAIKDVDGVFHQAALVSVQDSINEPINSINNNALGTFNIFEAARVNSIEKIVYASSAAIYGENTGIPLQETERPIPLSPYALDKWYTEELARVFFRNYGLKSIGLRYFNVYGPRQIPSSEYSGVISIFMSLMSSGKKVLIYGDGKQTRDFIFVKDVVSANIASMKSMKNAASIYNCGTGLSISINQLYAILTEVFSINSSSNYTEERRSEVRFSGASIKKIKREIDWHSEVNLRDGLRDLKCYINKKI